MTAIRRATMQQTGSDPAQTEPSLESSYEEVGPPIDPSILATLDGYPERLGEYRLLTKLGSGAMGSVFEAHDLFLDRRVAIKFINPSLLSQSAHERFLREARAIARLHHPNIIVIHRIGQHEGHWYLVSELVRGKSLDRLPGPVAPEEALRIARDLARGLGAAHRRGVLHRDIKPANAILAETGEVKLLDFGLAKLLTSEEGDALASSTVLGQSIADGSSGASQAGAVMGTPLYMALEIIRGQRATVRSDIYSLGALLYQLSTGTPPYQAQTQIQLAFLLASGEPRPLHERAPELPKEYCTLVDRCLRRDPSARPGSCEEISAVLEGLLLARRQGDRKERPLPVGNPYRGLRPFEAEHRGLFFGRELEIQELLDRLRGDAMVMLCGDSGVGKSSICRAGLLPAIVDGSLLPGRRWSSACLTPGPRPLATLADTLSSLCNLSEIDLAARICDDPGGVIQALVQEQGEGRGVALFIDQLEELVTQGDREEAARVAEFLGHLSVLVPGVRLIMTGRLDFLARLVALPGLGHELERSLYIVRPLSEDGLREAVTGPAARLGFSFESDGLVAELVSAAAAAEGGLPLLQFALSELWWARDQERHIIPARALTQIGGVAGALARHADSVVEQLQPAERHAARRLLSRLITEEGTRAARTQVELLGEGDTDGQAALSALVKGRLLVARESEGGGSYEIAHEALLHGWQTLRKWLAQDGEDRLARQRLDRAATEWVRLGRRRDVLWGEVQLRALSPHLLAGLSAQEAEFVHASQQAARRRRWQLRVGAAALPLLLLVGYGVVRLRDHRQLMRRVGVHTQAAQVSLEAGRKGAAELLTLQKQAFARYDDGQQTEGERLFQEAVIRFGEVEAVLRAAGREAEAALVLDRSGPASRRLFGEILLEQVLLLESATAPYGRAQQEDLVQRLATYDDGTLRERLNRDASLGLRTTAEGVETEATVQLRRYERKEGRMEPGPQRELGRTPLRRVALAPGSYLLELNVRGRTPVRLPLLLRSGEELALEVPVPKTVPAGYVYVPPGRFLYGAGGDEALRRLYGTVQPQHQVETAGYFIGRTEVTFGDWLTYLRALPEAERQKRLPRADRQDMQSKVALLQNPGGGYSLLLTTTGNQFSLQEGDTLVYAGRRQHQRHDWLRLPVAGVSIEDAKAYTKWLDQSGRLKMARLCSEHEWERAARGADGRSYPHGDVLGPDDANYDATYGRDPRSFGPDEVGSHPTSDSPFGVADLSGNVWEWTRSSVAESEVVYRGGGWYQGVASARSINRELGEPSLRDAFVGLRVCSDLK